ncbi:nitroreductase family protein [Streptococcus loxodontisalivarius]|uniref:Nitroreductase n=1 Tax=Streptococcus loxodontisalivarius TaxID=1349415 RepID=A0ABS2PRX7_9STRE|nr:nitroreductase family protein [Streptococcus loxodontisalivarius]MBM7642460.1 nitroreductase [Streptococcus loxodontisalivarius]
MKDMSFKEVMTGRRSVRSFDPDFKISHEEMLQMIDEAVTAPSSVNMQPWRFVIAESDQAKETLKPLIRFNTLQNETSSAMVIIFGDMISQENADAIYSQAVEEGKMPEEVKDKQLASIVPMYDNAPRQVMNDIVHIDASLAAMQFMLVARTHGYETNPIGGFDKENLAAAFGLDPDRYIPVMIIAIGKEKEAGYPSVRLSADKITQFK